MSVTAIRLHANDTIAVLTQAGAAGDACFVGDKPVILGEAIPGGHKVALISHAPGDGVIKYGYPIGVATKAIEAGAWVHAHNVRTDLSGDAACAKNVACAKNAARAGNAEAPQAAVSSSDSLDTLVSDSLPASTFEGYARAQGRPGIRNELWVIPTVGCINGELEALITGFVPPPWITAVRVLGHPFGCSQLGEDLERTADVLAGLACNPNAAGVVLAGLGCENLRLDMLRERLQGRLNTAWLTLQDDDGEALLLAALERLAQQAPRQRTLFPLSHLVVGVKCGGSDGYSGLTANPLVGRLADRVVGSGGVVLATEIPEMFGAEQTLLPRMANAQVADDFNRLDQWFKDYFISHGQPVHENPSPGNKEGGITTLEEKSLGAIEKAGSAPVVGVLRYGQSALDQSGVQILFAPGNDLVSCTALAASGAHMILFTTGRGTPFGTVVPTLKLSTNTALAQRHPGWIDFDAGTLLEHGQWNKASNALSDLVVGTANGYRAAHERKHIAQIALFKDGVIL